MTKPLTSIEPGVLDELNRLNAGRGPLVGWLEGLEAHRQEVSAAVYGRVREDYVKRIAELDRLATPLRLEATRAIGELDGQLAGLASEQRDIELDLEELELRYRLDEFSAEEFERRAQGPRARIEALTGEVGTLRASRERWVAARGEVVPEGPLPQARDTPQAKETSQAPDSPHATQAATATPGGSRTPEPPPPPVVAAPPAMAPAPPPPAAAVAAAAVGATVLSPASITMPRPIPPPRPSSAAIPVPPSVADGATRIGESLGPLPVAPPVAATMAPPPSMPAPPPLDRTVIYTPEPPADAPAGGVTQRLLARLVAVDAGEASVREHALAPVTTIGRVADNSLQLQQASVSRHHAILRLDAEGWMIEDLKAENGTWVNGERVGERRLADGDRVNIGAVRFVFRLD